MLEKLISKSLQQKGLILVAVVAIFIIGTFSLKVLPIDAFPDVTNIQVEVVCRAEGLSALEIERLVTNPTENTLRGLPKLKQLRSVTKYGLSVITIVFEDDVDIYFARQLVFERVNEAKEKIPAGATVELGPIATVMGEIYQYTLEGNVPETESAKKEYFTKLRTIQEWLITPQLKSVSGVNEINSFGGYLKQYNVEITPNKLNSYDLTPEDISSAIKNNNHNVGGNILERYSEQYIVRGIGLLKDSSDIANIFVKSNDGTAVYIKDIGKVTVGVAVRQGASLINGKEEAVGGIVMMLRGENSSDVVKRVKSKIEEINTSGALPDGIKISPYYDRSDIISASLRTVSSALIEGAILVLIILYIFLRNIRSSIVVLIALPLSLLVTFTIMKLTGLSANLMSLGGLAISIGLIIDATIIQVENVQRHLAESEDKSAMLILKSVMEVRKPSILGEFIIAIIFIPILSLEGIEGKMFSPLALTVAAALLASLMLSIFVIPVLCLVFLKKDKHTENKLILFLQRIYNEALVKILKRGKSAIAIASVLLVISIGVFTLIGTEFIPIMDEGSFDMDISLLPGVSLDKAMEINKLVGEKLKGFNQLETVVSRTGQTGVALDTRGVDKTGYVGIFKPKSEWKGGKSRDEIIAEMREELEQIPGITFGFSQPIQCRIDELVAGTRAQLIVKVFGDDIEILKEKGNQISEVLSKIKGATDLAAEKTTGQPYLTIEIKRDRLARYGISAADLLNIIEIAVAGKPVSTLYEENKSFDITVRYPESSRNSIDVIKKILVPGKNGSKIPIGDLADVAVKEGPLQISRENGRRRLGIELNIQNRDIGSFVTEARAKIEKQVKLPAGYYITYGGQFENQQRAMGKMMIVLPLIVGMIFLLLYFTFGKVKTATLVLLNLPFALIGGIFSLYISGLYLSVPASIGFIVLFGVAVLNGVVLVSHITQIREEENLSAYEAVIKGCNDRLRPVLMTALIAIFSLIPMIFATGPGSEIQKPLAVVVVGGLISSTLLTLLLIPTMYLKFEK